MPQLTYGLQYATANHCRLICLLLKRAGIWKERQLLHLNVKLPEKVSLFMEHKETVKQWIELADKDLALAEHTAKTMWPIPFELVCFHCQQSIEKYLKAFLVSKGQDPPYVHDLVKLVTLCETENPDMGQKNKNALF